MLYTSPWSRLELEASVVVCTDCIGSCKSNYLPYDQGHDGKWDSYNRISIYVNQGTSTRPNMFFIGGSNFTSPPVSNTNLTLNTLHTPFQYSLSTYHTPFLYSLNTYHTPFQDSLNTYHTPFQDFLNTNHFNYHYSFNGENNKTRKEGHICRHTWIPQGPVCIGRVGYYNS